ncbi:hypothetical protein EVG20_g3734 [Dentipellis fragilis]|uniref:Uncharacterized protein n=1 Tax=Dentipellis fragilis TaxID=205917 RepID=A0A4Y9Z1R3_9AGAM|nr:hypothetical protein EVG20_g3734 [Dentipellis fragilis]
MQSSPPGQPQLHATEAAGPPQADLEMFRASPWISYGPISTDSSSPHHASRHGSEMDEDVDMDAPQISTLREEDSPPPTSSPARTGKFRVKLLVNNEAKANTKFISFNGETGEEAGETDEVDEEDEADEEDDEEDQLIDDDDDVNSVSVASGPPVAGPSSRGGPSKRGQKKSRGQGKRRGRAGAPTPVALMSTFEASPAEHPAAVPSPLREPLDLPIVEALTPSSPIPKKKPVPKGTTAAQRAPRRFPKTKTTITIPAVQDVADLSEGYTGTAPSSPLRDINTPEIEPNPSAAPSGVPQLEDFNLENVPLPRYPLPSKPFHVQAPPRIGTAYAPIVPIDRSGKRPRHWRQANREIRGIAGGRWFARSWVGEKESDLASTATAAGEDERQQVSSAAVMMPKIPAISLSAPLARSVGRPKGSKADPAVSTAASSRSVSVVPDIAPAGSASAGRAQTKKRSNLSTAAVTEIDKEIELVS